MDPKDAIEKGVCLAGRLLANTPRQMRTEHVASADPAAFAHPPVFCAHVASSPFLTTTTMSSAIRALRHISLSSSRAFAVHGAARSVSRAAFPVFAARAGPAASRSFSVSARRFGEGACESFSASSALWRC